ncbi:hypothetical protein J2R98_000747 [Alkalibacillus filiformis]|uniref:DUF3221 domain-containing protein n=1 Tax=Alkalibacillus filiformis TaxID=200990 RepID=A0ABU0DR69_9BACI|nr:hypothetical protein [Alkalibacillus filiformis]MDQ0350944.1 hypothetical protein [Alkalibacillus filiformis]
MKLKLISLLFLSISLPLSACGYSNTMESTSDTLQHSVLRGVVTDVNHTDQEIIVEGETKQVNLRVTENSEMLNRSEEAIQFEDLERGLEVSVSWMPKDSEGQNQVELEKLELVEN